eukprot:TRINITY_DN10770_c0_g4_i1.p1 TRINITY_DN10770_c0_g4~~TRINITY_DN10770_c0_g4_i1.p1  ORF type:complete len:699 (-),score=111.64 TRINITY_DN10770_c0_g4_i1:322-2418(-)
MPEVIEDAAKYPPEELRAPLKTQASCVSGSDSTVDQCKVASLEDVASVTAPILRQLDLVKHQLGEVLDGQVKLTAALSDRSCSKTLMLAKPERQVSPGHPTMIPEDASVASEPVLSFRAPTGSRQPSKEAPLPQRPIRRRLTRSLSTTSSTFKRVRGAAEATKDVVRDVSDSDEQSEPEPVSPLRKRGGRILRAGSNLSRLMSNKGDEARPKGTITFNTLCVEEAASPALSIQTPFSEGGAAIEVKRSKSCFEAFRTEEEDKEDLLALFVLAEDWAQAQTAPPSAWEQLRSMSTKHLDLTVDSVIGTLIVLNAIFIGVSMDAPESHAHVVVGIDVFFSVAFILELSLKVAVHGIRGHFRGDNRWMNTFDAALILMDLVQLAMQACLPSDASNVADLPSASIFRVVRLVRLVRILRLLRHPALQTLLMMLHGMVGGLPTLGWALILFVSSVYIVALMLREFLGRTNHDRIYDYFDSVPRSMVTTFRCSFGDCSTIEGTPIFEHVDSVYGFGFSVFYCLFAFVMSIGMFNVISAIFVQSTMTAASALKNKRKKERLQDDELWASRIYVIVRKLLDYSYPWSHEESSLSALIDSVYDMSVESSHLELVVADPAVKAALEELDIDPEDNGTLADVLDVDQTGDIALIELLQGLRRLRGNPRRSDIVAVDLTCRSMQNTLKDIQSQLKALKGKSDDKAGRKKH